ncbi:FAD-dependent thymidylate synthase [Aeromonas veronii]|uniref:FAD-dependent thymidylate synthase n=1 Tax=Aeromonas veronii TaxID=654 RepID=UPI003BA13461
MIKAEYIDHMGDDLRVANVARVSFAKWKETLDDTDARLIKFLALHEHTSPFRHTAITVRCSAPVYLARQLGKHQVGMSWNEESRRYVSNKRPVLHKQEFRTRPDGAIKQGSSDVLTVFPTIKLLGNEYPVEMVLEALVDAYEEAVDMTGPYRVAPECARAVLPQNMVVTWVWTGSLAAFFHMYRLRISGHAQKEARNFSDQIGLIIKNLFPACWDALEEATKEH